MSRAIAGAALAGLILLGASCQELVVGAGADGGRDAVSAPVDLPGELRGPEAALDTTPPVDLCAPPPPCNWCGGAEVKDGKGCVVGYRCANDADPCLAGPCNDPTDCVGVARCGADGLCWPCVAEICNGIDDDCDGNLDDGATCPPGQACIAGTCQ